MTSKWTKLGVAAIALFAAACEQTRKEPAPVVYQGTVPQARPAQPAQPQQPSPVAPRQAPAPIPSGQSDGRGVVFYEGYETIRARDGDTVTSMAARVGLSGAELAAYNGLSTQYQPREGDELVLPARPDRYQGAIAITAVPEETQVAAATQTPTETPASPPQATPESAPGTQPSGSGWSAELARAAIFGTPGASEETTESAAAAPAPEQAPAPTPAPVQAAPEPAPAPEPTELAAASPEPAPQAAPASSGSGVFVRPTTAPISRSFSRTPGPSRNDGVDFATQAGDPVQAADDGVVALISKSLGGLGTIVLVRHDNEFLTVYGRVDGVTVKKGDRVSRGQTIAEVANLSEPREPHLHFEVRRGAESVDPALYF